MLGTDTRLQPGARAWLPTKPWPLLLTGYGIVVVGILLSLVSADALTPARVVLLLAGQIVAGSAVWLRLRSPWQGPAWKSNAGWLVLASAMVPWLACFGMDPDWDSMILVLNVLTGVAIAGALLVAVPSPVRRGLVSMLAVVHFFGIFVATTAIGVAPSAPPWWNGQFWARAYRGYYRFMYLTNAYHFYSPNPGPPTLLWLRIEYEDHSFRWVEVPVRKDYPTVLAFQRRLGLGEKANTVNLTTTTYLAYAYDRFLQRQVQGARRGIPLGVDYPAAMSQYTEPTADSKYALSSYARHAASAYPSESNPDLKVAGVKIYKVTHNMLTARQFNEGEDPLDPALYEAYFEGDFTPDGELKPNDGFYYWRIPIVWVPIAQASSYPVGPNPPVRNRGEGPTRTRDVLVNYVKVHAGDIH